MARPSLTLCVFVDALGWELLRQRSFLDETLVERRPLETVFGYSCTCCPTILTGRLPRDHGHLSFYYYDPDRSPFKALRWLSMLPRSLARRGRVRRLLSRAIARIYGYTGYFQLYNVPFDALPYMDYLEKKDIYQPQGIRGGVPTIFDRLREARVPFYMSDWRAPEETNLRDMGEVLERGHVRFAYLYLASLDALLHAKGTNSDDVERKIRWYEDQLRTILTTARRSYGDVRLFLFSDHGMTNIVDSCDLISRVDALGLRFGTDYAAMYDSTMARFWFLRDSARDAIVETLREEPRGHIMEPPELEAYGCNFADSRYGELFFLLQPGTLLCPSFMGEQPMAGMHGYDPGHPQAMASFAASVPVASPPGRLDDLHDLMLADVGLSSPAKSLGEVAR